MPAGLIELGEIMVAGAQRRLETVSQNVSNLTTPGYRKGVMFDRVLAGAAGALALSTDFAAGPLRLTGQPFDLAITGEGFFRVRGENGFYYTRGGQFSRDGEGHVVDGQGLALQTVDGRDLVINDSGVEIAEDGTVIEDGAPVARIGAFAPTLDGRLERIGGAYFAVAGDLVEEASSPILRQGMLEGSNVELSTEMLTMMNALRQAEAGARVVQLYDGLIGQTISTLGRAPA